MKNIQVSFDEKTINILEQIAQFAQKTRTAVIREAVEDWLKQKRITEFESGWIEALKKDTARYGESKPAEDGDAWLAAEVWDDT